MLITNFASGELSRKISGRTDIAQYYSGAAHLENYSIIPTGGIHKRAGFRRMGMLSGPCRLIPFILDKDNSFIFEFTPRKIFVWKNGSKVMSGMVQVSIECTYRSIAEINEIHYAQDYDTMIFTQRNNPPFMITYDFATETFTSGAMSFDFSPDVTLDDDFGYVTVAKDALPEYDAEHPYCIFRGRLYRYDTQAAEWKAEGEDPDVDEELFTAENKYPATVAFFNNRLFFASTSKDRQKVWASCAPKSKGARYNEFATYEKYVTVNRVVKEADLHVFTANISSIDTANGKTTLTNVTQNLAEQAENDIGLYYLSQDDYVPVGTKCLSFQWDEASKKGTLVVDRALTGKASAVVFTIQLWKSASAATADDYEFQVASNNQVTADSSFNFSLASDQNDAIRFLGAGKYLAVGTESSVWAVPSNVTALSVRAEMSGRYGSDGIQAHCVDTAIIFFSQGKYAIREYYYSTQAEAFQTNNIAILAEQMLTESPAKDFDFMTNPYNRLIVTREDGRCVTLLYDKNNGIMGWQRISHAQGSFSSCAVVRGDGPNDLIYMAVETEEGFFLEQMDEGSGVHMDSWETYDPQKTYGDSFVIYNESKDKVHNLKDGDVPTGFMSDGDTVIVGVPFRCTLTSLPVVNGDPTGKKRIVNLTVRFLDSYMPVMKCGNVEEFFTDVAVPYSGVRKIDYPGVSDRDVSFTLDSQDPHRVCILCVNALLA